MWILSFTTNEESVHSPSKAELSSKNTLASRLLINLLKLKKIDSIVFVKVQTTGRVSKWADVFGRAALTNGSWKMLDRLIFSIHLL